jgi:hypothetical protein
MAIYSNRIVVSVSKTEMGLKITNSQSTPTQAGLQVMWQVPVSTLQARIPWLNSNLSNLRFLYNGQYIPAWLESINNGTATIWIKMPVSIPANSSITLNLYSNSTLNFDGTYWGEAPQLSSTYGQYDNGASVFNYYNNFVGGLGTTIVNNGESVIFVSDGIDLTSGTGESVVASYSMANLIINQNYYNQNYIFQAGMNFRVFDSDIYDSFGLYLMNTASSTAWQQENTILNFAQLGSGVYQTMWESVQNPQGTYTGYSGSVTWSMNETFILGMTVVGNSVTDTFNYNTIIPAKQNYNPPTQYPAFGSWRFSVVHFYWVRILAYPPNGVMPTVELM